MRKTKQMIIDELNARIKNMYTVSEYNDMRDKLKKEIEEKQYDYKKLKLCLDYMIINR